MLIEKLAPTSQMTIRWILTAVSILMVLSFAQPSTSEADERVMVKLTDGQVLRGIVDRRTSSARLWLRFEAGGTQLLRGIVWERIVLAKHADQTISPSRLRRDIGYLLTGLPNTGTATPNDRYVPPDGRSYADIAREVLQD